MKDQFCIVSFGNRGWYPQGLTRLKASCEKFGINCMTFTDYPIGCPTHEELPYAFKIACMEIAFRQYNKVLWLDASGWLTQDPTPIIEHLDKYGYLLLNNHGQFNHWWCNDRQLQGFGYTRDEAQTQPHAVGGMIGFDKVSAGWIFDEWADNVGLFAGRWDNNLYTESHDERCQGSRHDQSVISLIAAKHGLDLQNQAGWVTFAPETMQGIVAMQGM